MDEVVVQVQAKPYGAEIAQTAKARDGEERIDGAENEAEKPRAPSARAEAGEKCDQAAEKMEQIMGGRKREIKHFVPEETGDADHDQDETAQKDVDFCECGLHGVRMMPSLSSSVEQVLKNP